MTLEGRDLGCGTRSLTRHDGIASTYRPLTTCRGSFITRLTPQTADAVSVVSLCSTLLCLPGRHAFQRQLFPAVFPLGSEVERRISFFTQTLTTSLPEALPVDAMPTFSVLTPHSSKRYEYLPLSGRLLIVSPRSFFPCGKSLWGLASIRASYSSNISSNCTVSSNRTLSRKPRF